MCDYSTVVRNDSKEEANRESALNMYNDGVKVEKIAQYLVCSIDTVKKWVGLMPAIK